MFRFTLGVALFVSLLSFAVHSQDDTNEKVVLPDAIMKQVVARILTYEFRPRRIRTTIPLAASQVKREWLPTIKNIEFDLVPDKQIPSLEKGVFLFEPVVRDGDGYTINVGWGDLCSASGGVWKFSLADGKVRLWPLNGTWGRGCSYGLYGGVPHIKGLEVGEVSPNELEGYKFFNGGRLEGIRLALSAREDLIRLFGKDCKNGCDYNANWSLTADYIRDGLAWTTTLGIGPAAEKTEFFGKQEFIGKLRSIVLRPKSRISFASRVFPDRIFRKASLFSIGDSFGVNGFEGAVHTTYTIYRDGYGLQYTVYDEETFNNLKSPRSVETKSQKGDLVGIEYSIPDSVKDSIYDKRRVEPETK